MARLRADDRSATIVTCMSPARLTMRCTRPLRRSSDGMRLSFWRITKIWVTPLVRAKVTSASARLVALRIRVSMCRPRAKLSWRSIVSALLRR